MSTSETNSSVSRRGLLGMAATFAAGGLAAQVLAGRSMEAANGNPVTTSVTAPADPALSGISSAGVGVRGESNVAGGTGVSGLADVANGIGVRPPHSCDGFETPAAVFATKTRPPYTRPSVLVT